jgi:hypothetical protein
VWIVEALGGHAPGTIDGKQVLERARWFSASLRAS